MFERSYISSLSTGGYWQCSSSISWLHFDIVESKCWLELYVCFNLLEVYFSLTQFMIGAALVAREMTLPFSKNKFITFAWHWRDVFTLFFYHLLSRQLLCHSLFWWDTLALQEIRSCAMAKTTAIDQKIK